MFGSLTLWISLQTLEKHSDGWIKVKESPGNLDQDNVLFYQPLFILQYLHQDSSVLQQNWCLFLGSGIITHFLVHYSLFYFFFCSLWPFPRTALPSFNFPLDSFLKTLLKGSVDDHCNPTSSLFDMQHLLLAFDLAHFSYSILFLSVFSYFSHALQHPTHCYKPSSHHPKPCIYTASWNQEVFSTTFVQLTLPYSHCYHHSFTNNVPDDWQTTSCILRNFYGPFACCTLNKLLTQSRSQALVWFQQKSQSQIHSLPPFSPYTMIYYWNVKNIVVCALACWKVSLLFAPGTFQGKRATLIIASSLIFVEDDFGICGCLEMLDTHLTNGRSDILNLQHSMASMNLSIPCFFLRLQLHHCW